MTSPGEDTRKNDHDTLTRIDVNLNNFMARFQEHTEQDRNHFTDLDNRTSRVERFTYVLTGAFIILEVVFRLFLHHE